MGNLPRLQLSRAPPLFRFGALHHSFLHSIYPPPGTLYCHSVGGLVLMVAPATCNRHTSAHSLCPHVLDISTAHSLCPHVLDISIPSCGFRLGVSQFLSKSHEPKVVRISKTQETELVRKFKTHSSIYGEERFPRAPVTKMVRVPLGSQEPCL